MPTTLRANSFSAAIIQEIAQLDANAAAAATSLTLKSNQGLTVGDFLYAGTLSQERCEKCVVASLTGTTGVGVGALGFAHLRFEPITQVSSDQIRFYRAANADGSVPVDASFSIVATRNIDPDQTGTFYTDSAGGSDYWYKYTYYNSVTLAETPLADAAAVRGSDFAHYVTLDAVRTKAGFGGNTNLSDTIVDQARRDAESEVNSALISKYTVPFTKPVPELVRRITLELAAGILLLDQYGAMATGSSKDGTARVADARALLKAVQTGASPLVDYQGTQVAETKPSASSWPDDTTADTDPADGGGERIFIIERPGSRF
ncbi:phage protein Gp36 family protein [Streptomyces sp. NPDC058469]|uniref:phage protein Gp36 family protein n=1 Tax=Streptomyces sp. NPDC058469 TaxID=3346514 RepID=UPI00365FB7AB